MKQYSIEAIASKPVALPDPLVLLDTGFNVFTVMTDDLEGIKAMLENEGVTFKSINCIEQDVPVRLEDELLPDESLAKVLGYGQEIPENQF